MKCSICGDEIQPQRTPQGEVYWDQGHNAVPVTEGRCCDLCNTTVVIPKRMERITSWNSRYRLVRKKLKENGRRSLTDDEKSIIDGSILNK